MKMTRWATFRANPISWVTQTIVIQAQMTQQMMDVLMHTGTAIPGSSREKMRINGNVKMIFYGNLHKRGDYITLRRDKPIKQLMIPGHDLGHLLELGLYIPHHLELGATPIQIVIFPVYLEIDVAVQVIGQKPYTALERHQLG